MRVDTLFKTVRITIRSDRINTGELSERKQCLEGWEGIRWDNSFMLIIEPYVHIQHATVQT